MTKKRGIVVIAASVIFVIGVIIAILVAGCGKTADNKVSTADEVIGTSVQTVTQVVTDAQGNTHIEEETKVVEVKQTQPAEKSENETSADKNNNDKSNSNQSNNSNSSGNNNNQTNLNNNSGNAQSSKTNNSSNSGQTSKSNGSSGSTNKPASGSSSQSKPSSSKSESSQTTQPAPAQQPTKDAHEGKTWHDAEYKTEKVWVVDEEGYTWQKPIYETHDRTICNTCGADITDCVGEHGYNHLINGEDASYRNEMVDTLVGYETVEEPEKGHWESKTTLVRPEGWY